MITNAVIFLSLILGTLGQVYEDKRCKCVCPSPAMVFNSTGSPQRKLYIADVPPSKCNCVEAVLPRLGDLKGREAEYCPRCECKYETRNTTVIKVVVITVVWLTSSLLLYAGFLACLNPLMRRKRTYKDHSEEVAGDINGTALHRLVVITMVWLTSSLLLYAGFLACLNPLMRRKRTYKDHSEEGRACWPVAGDINGTALHRLVVITMVWLTSSLLLYAGFLACLNPLMRRKRTYKDHSEETRHLMLSYEEED